MKEGFAKFQFGGTDWLQSEDQRDRRLPNGQSTNMGCCDVVGLRHSVCVVTLTLGWALVIAGVASPLWRYVKEEEEAGVPVGTRCWEGLWQQCRRLGKYDTTCWFSQRTSGLWRAVQVVKVTSLFVLTCAVTCLLVEVLLPPPPCRPSLRCAARGCPPSFPSTLLGGLLALVGDLLYVGYTEYHTTRLPGEHVYYWSFALSVGGSCLSLFAALVLGLTARLVPPVDQHPLQPKGRRAAYIKPWSRDTDSSWDYYPNKKSYNYERGFHRKEPFRPYTISDDYRRSCYPYPTSHPRPRRFDDVYVSRGSDQRFVNGGLHRPRPYNRPDGPPRSHQGHCPPTLEPGPRLYPDLQAQEARRDYTDRNIDIGQSRSMFQQHPPGQIPTAPGDSLARNSFRYPSTDEELLGYSYGRRSAQPYVENDSRSSRPTVIVSTTGNTDESSTIQPQSDSDDNRGQARPEVLPPEAYLPPPPPPEAAAETLIRRWSSAPLNVSTQTSVHHPYPARPSFSEDAQRHVQFEDQRGWEPRAAHAPNGRENLIHASRSAHEHPGGHLERSHHEAAHRVAVESPRRAADQDPGRSGDTGQREQARRVQDAGGLDQRDYLPVDGVEGGFSVLRQQMALERPRPPGRRRPSLPLSASSQEQQEYWWGPLNRHPGQRRMLIKTRKGLGYDRFDLY